MHNTPAVPKKFLPLPFQVSATSAKQQGVIWPNGDAFIAKYDFIPELDSHFVAL